ncbi:centrosomal protein POC5 isoform X2 [Motacilla alba alba]|uniref:centrosomal protein POC5 isoform X2 n=1 Tax=Motacilla alba alba TaxID=1094192 RepID=UPI0018D526DB|nr:centrosomal protein POC5 isoform X2 [Motacilla alba alba]
MCRMSSDEEKSTSPVFLNDFIQDSSVSSDSQDEYEELFRYSVVTPKFEQCVSKLPEPASERRPSERVSRLTDDASHLNTPVSTSVKQAGMEQPALPEASSSTHGPREVSKTTVTELTSPDGKVTQIENIVDLWSGNLKTNILTELKNWELNLIQQHKLQMRQEKEKHATQVKQLQNELENLKELLHTYEISISRKDEEYAIRMADRHFQTTLMKKVWATWRSVIEERWKDKVARACQLRAENVCIQITNDYEAKIAELTAALELARSEVLRLHTERDQYEDTMKKAFMRGVCALNLEAMTMFQSKDSRPDPDIGSRRNDHATTGAERPPPSQYNQPSPPPPPAAGVQMENMFCCHLAHASTPETRLDSDSPVIVTSTTSGSGVTSTQKLPIPKVITSAQQKAGRTITARITGRADMGQKSRASGSLAVMGVAPPMSSVIVEKHHPVTQQTISQATAAKYPRTVLHSSGSTTSRPAGQAGRVLPSQTHTSVQSIKVVD